MNFYGNLLSQGFNFLGQFVQFAILARLLSPAEFGVLGVIFAIAQFLYIFFDYGFTVFGTRYVALNKRHAPRIDRMFGVSLGLKTVLYLASATGLAAYCLIVPTSEVKFLPLLGIATGFYFWALSPIWLLIGLEGGMCIAVLTFIYRVLPCLALLLFHSISLNTFALLYAGLAGLACAVAMTLVRRMFGVRFRRPTWRRMWHVAIHSIDPFLSTLTTTAYTTLTVLYAGHIVGSVALGYYLSADRLCRFFAAGFLPIIQSFYPTLVRLHHQNREAFRRLFLKLAMGILGLAVVASLIFFQASELIVRIVYGAKYVPEVSGLLKMLAPLCFVLTSSSLLANFAFHARNQSARLRNIYLMAGVVNLVTLIPLVGKFHVHGVVYTSLILESMIVLTMITFAMRRFRGERSPA